MLLSKGIVHLDFVGKALADHFGADCGIVSFLEYLSHGIIKVVALLVDASGHLVFSTSQRRVSWSVMSALFLRVCHHATTLSTVGMRKAIP